METKKLLKLTIGGKEYPCRVTMGAMTRFKHESGKDVSKMGQGDIGELVLFIYCCVKSACNADGVAFDMDFETFADHLEPDSVNAFYASSGESGEKKTSRQLFRSRHRRACGHRDGVHRDEP